MGSLAIVVMCLYVIGTAFGAVEIVNGRCPGGKKPGDKWYKTGCRECFCETGKWACTSCRDLNVGHDRSKCYNDYAVQRSYPACCVATLKCRGEPGFSEIRLLEELNNITTTITPVTRKFRPSKIKVPVKKPPKNIKISWGRDKKKKHKYGKWYKG